MTGRAPGIEVGAYHPEAGASDTDARRHRYPALQHQWELDCLRLLQCQGGEDCIAPIAAVEAIAHRWRVAKTEPECSSSLHDVFLRSQTGDQNSSRPTSLSDHGHRMVAPKGFLRQYDQRQVGVGAMGSEFAIADAGDHLLQAAASDPDVPAEDQDTPTQGVSATFRGVVGYRGSYVLPPALQPLLSAVIMMELMKAGTAATRQRATFSRLLTSRTPATELTRSSVSHLASRLSTVPVRVTSPPST